MKKLIIAFAVLAFPLAVSAQSNELGVFVSMPQFESTTIADEDLGDFELEFEEDMGYGVNFNHYFSPNLSLDLAAQSLSAEMQASLGGGGATLTFDIGEIDLMAYSAALQFHFGRGARFAPYVGGGAAYVTGDVEILEDPENDPDATEELDLENEITWLANAGVNINLTPSFAINGDVKYIAYEAAGEDAEEGDELEINPLVISAGVRFRF